MEYIVAGGKKSDSFVIAKRTHECEANDTLHLLQLAMLPPKDINTLSNPISAITLEAYIHVPCNRPAQFCFYVTPRNDDSMKQGGLFEKLSGGSLTGQSWGNFLTQAGVKYKLAFEIKNLDDFLAKGFISRPMYNAAKEFERVITDTPSILTKDPPDQSSERQTQLLQPVIKLAGTDAARQVA